MIEPAQHAGFAQEALFFDDFGCDARVDLLERPVKSETAMAEMINVTKSALSELRDAHVVSEGLRHSFCPGIVHGWLAEVDGGSELVEISLFQRHREGGPVGRQNDQLFRKRKEGGGEAPIFSPLRCRSVWFRSPLEGRCPEPTNRRFYFRTKAEAGKPRMRTECRRCGGCA